LTAAPTLVVTIPPTRVPERRYVLETVLTDFLGLAFRIEIGPPGGIEIALDASPEQASIVMPDHLLGLDDGVWLRKESLDTAAVRQVRVADVSTLAIFGTDLPSTDGVRVPFDLFGTIFFCLTRYEEYVVASRDQFGRPIPATLPITNALLRRPLVNEYVELLWRLLSQLSPRLSRKARAYRLAPSHDVDEFSLKGRTLRSVGLSVGADFLQRREPLLAGRRVGAYLATIALGHEVDWDPYYTFGFLMDVSERCNLRSTFFFVSRITDAAMDPRYDIADPAIGRTIASIAARGHEVGLHGSFNSSVDESAFEVELAALQKACSANGVAQERWGARQHCLRLAVPGTWRSMSNAGIAYDASLGFAPSPGFRAACCYEFPVWDLEARERLGLWEQPLIAMDVTFLSYGKKTLEQTADDIATFAGTCKSYDGVMTLLWHNHMLASKRSRAVYRELVEAIA
jgi:hypothetical protein